MSNELIRAAQKNIVHSKSISGAAGKGLVTVGAGGLGLMTVAAFLPLITLPMLLVMMVVAGLFLWE